MIDTGRSGRTPLSVRLLVTYALAFLAVIALMGWFIERSTRVALLEDLTNNLERAALLAAESLPDETSELAQWAESMFDVGGFRTTLIKVDGVVLADSHTDPSVMENHGDRPEVVEALQGEVGIDTRTSTSTGFDQLYVAIPPTDGAVVRVSMPTRAIEEELATVRSAVLLVSIATGLIGVLVVGFVGNRMAKPITALTEQSQLLAEGDLEVSPRRSSVREYDQLGVAISSLATSLGRRLTDAERATEYLEVVLGALEQGTVLFASDGSVVYSNASAAKLLGPVAKNLGEFSPYSCQLVVREAQRSGVAVDREIEHGKPTRRIQIIATPFTDDDRVLLVAVDVTAQERIASIRRDFVANASHELKTPVATIIASSEALQIAVERDDPTASEFAAQIAASSHQLDELVSDLLDLSRLERESPDLIPTQFDLLVGDEVRQIGEKAKARGLVLEADLKPTTAQVSHSDISIAVRNLLDNAVRYTDEGGRISVTLVTEEDTVVLKIADTGEGIPTKDLERLFERFYRVDSGRARSTGGTGLGLAIARHVVESHGGSIEVDSTLGIGSTFTIRLPA